MSKALITEAYLTDIADAIRAKNGSSDTYTPPQMAAAIGAIPTGGITPTGTISITENGNVDVTNYATAAVNVSGGGSNVKGFELYAADNAGYTQTSKGLINNNYLVYYFDDNMSSTLLVNGAQNASTIAIAYGQHNTIATTKAVSNSGSGQNAIMNDGTEVTAYHTDSGSYISVIGGWVGYEAGGTIYENAVNNAVNTIDLNSAHSKLLIFVGACGALQGVNTVTINGDSYTLTNIGARYDGQYGMYGAIVIENNQASSITVTFLASCYNYVSIIGID